MNINVKYQGKETSSEKYGCNFFFSNIQCDDTTTSIVEYLNSVPCTMSVTIYKGPGYQENASI